MNGILFDTHLLLWVVTNSPALPLTIRKVIESGDELIFFSPASLQEVAIKHALGKEDFDVDAGRVYRALLDSGYRELPLRGDHAVAVGDLPPAHKSPDGHKDPFDRLLIAQAAVDRLQLATSDPLVARYKGDIVLHPKRSVSAAR